MTYNRKYYLIRCIKAEGFDLLKSENSRIILVPENRIKDSQISKAVQELIKEHRYGVQLMVEETLPAVSARATAFSALKIALRNYIKEIFPPRPRLGTLEKKTTR